VAGYSLAKLEPPGAKLFSRVFVSVMLIPGQVLILPIYLMLSRLHLVGSHAGLMLLYVATNLPFATFFMSIAFRGLPTEVIEAARMDGAGFGRTLVSVVLPMSTSGLATLAVLQFMAMWNELLYAFILLPDESQRLLTPALSRVADRYLNEQPLIAAGLLLAASVPVLLLALSSRYLIKGISVGAVR
jgi:ABC-type glycerol-3-phosphate transport system permease component